MRKRVLRVLILLVVLGGAVVLGNAWLRNKEHSASNELVLYGNVDIRQVDLAFFERERIASLLVNEGDSVTKGQLLGTLDKQRFRYQLALAEARVQSQREVVARMEAGTRPEEIRKARADLEAAQARVIDAKRTYERIERATRKGAAAMRELDDAVSARDASMAQAEALRAALDLALAGPRKEDIAAAKAQLAEREAQLNLARRNLDDANLYAPSDGVIQDRLLEVGDMASPQKAVYTIALKSPLWIRVYVDEPDLGKIVPGMPAKVKTDSYPGKVYDGWVGFISPTAEFTPKSVETPQLRTHLVYQVRVFVDDPQNELRLGMPATVILSFDETKNTNHQENSTGEDVGRDATHLDSPAQQAPADNPL